MSYYQTYQQQPGWGTNAYQFALPTQPVYQPQATWGGEQFFRAQAGLRHDFDDYAVDDDDDYDDRRRRRGLFNSIWRRRQSFSNGLPPHEAQAWHRRIYGGLTQPNGLGPSELGAAAGFEAFRQWSKYATTYRSGFGSDMAREREALAGIATGEAMKLNASIMLGRGMSFEEEAAEIAIATAYRLFEEDYDPEDRYDRGYGGRYRPTRRRSSFTYGDAPGPVYGGPLGGGGIPIQATGPGYVSAHPAGYVSAQPTGFVQAQGTGYVQAQPGYMGQPGIAYAPMAQTPMQPGFTGPIGGMQYQQTGVSYLPTGGGLGVPDAYGRPRTLSGNYGSGYVAPRFL